MNKAQSNLKYKKGYGKNYANLRKKGYNDKEDYTVRGLAEKLGITPSTISLIEKEQRTPTIEQVNIYKDFFNVSLDYLTGETKTMCPKLGEVCKMLGLNENTVNYFYSLEQRQKMLIEFMVSQFQHDELTDRDENLFTRFLSNCDEFLCDDVNRRIGKKALEIRPLIQYSDISKSRGRNFALSTMPNEDMKKALETIEGSGFSVVETDLMLEARLISLERQIGDIILSISNDQADQYLKSATWASTGEPVIKSKGKSKR